MEYQRIRVARVAAALGAEVSGIDLKRALDDQTVSEIERAFLEFQVLFFREQHLTVEQHKAFARCFGPLHIHPLRKERDGEGHPEVLVQRTGVQRPYLPSEWHSDVTFQQTPPKAGILRAVEIPPVGGDTLWSSMYAAHDALSESMRGALAGLEAIHDFIRVDAFTQQQQREHARDRGATHPIIRTHPETGRKFIFVNRVFTKRVKGMHEAESRALLEFLYQHVASPDFTCRFRWSAGSIVMWDQRCTMHRVVADNVLAPRHVERVTVCERPSS